MDAFAEALRSERPSIDVNMVRPAEMIEGLCRRRGSGDVAHAWSIFNTCIHWKLGDTLTDQTAQVLMRSCAEVGEIDLAMDVFEGSKVLRLRLDDDVIRLVLSKSLTSSNVKETYTAFVEHLDGTGAGGHQSTAAGGGVAAAGAAGRKGMQNVLANAAGTTEERVGGHGGTKPQDSDTPVRNVTNLMRIPLMVVAALVVLLGVKIGSSMVFMTLFNQRGIISRSRQGVNDPDHQRHDEQSEQAQAAN